MRKHRRPVFVGLAFLIALDGAVVLGRAGNVVLRRLVGGSTVLDAVLGRVDVCTVKRSVAEVVA